MALKKENLIEKRNVLNEIRRNNMTLQEMRFFSIYLSKINARDITTRRVRFPLSDFQKIMEFGRLNTAQLKATTDSLLGKVVSIPNERGGYTSFQLFKECTVDKDEYDQWYVEIDAHDKALPLMFEFKDSYFTYELWNALRLKSGNQLRMYELLKQYEQLGERKLPLPLLKELLGLSVSEYPRWDNFKNRVLDSCQQALAESTDIKFTYKPIKAGRKITGVHFFIQKNKDYVDQLTLAEFIHLHPDPDDLDADDEPEDLLEDLPTAYSSDVNEFLAEACNMEFSDAQMTVLRDLLVRKIPTDKDGLERFNYLLQTYHRLQAADEKATAKGRNIADRFAYLCRIIEKDTQSSAQIKGG